MEMTQERIEYLINRFTVIASVKGSMIVELSNGEANYTEFEYFEDYGKVYIHDRKTDMDGYYGVDTDYYTLIDFLDELAKENDKDY